MAKVQSAKSRKAKEIAISAPAAPLPDRIVEAAIDLLKSRSPHQLTYREIAAHAGVSHMAPYRYFKSLEEIFIRICDDGAARLNQMLREAIQTQPLHPDRQLKAAGLAYLRFATENSVHFGVMTSEIISHAKTTQRENQRAAFAVLLQVVHNCQLKGLLSPKQNSEKIAFMLWSMVHGLTMLSLLGHDQLLKVKTSPRETIELFLSATLKGLGDVAEKS